ncbi:hypothetical protein AUEXF2481DRAFT_633463 [Aureobasidium subglaciale EXF-2481]|uniref:Uncharacterized protein n=1 Tax=Aureobasidium subglaciale (strain EXF-2481) TaxID=1043005 RepID=A0A074YEV0_AURSE|nr:uncharacterized protein AUEXF2481DRAFT_633463 [Aureobasidium subglaciale EXF-2481]KEQ96338.1 hypothetical protein AUEXF2481DRAFT_633463 [Aureobasidium subglaciale EXF-2481]
MNIGTNRSRTGANGDQINGLYTARAAGRIGPVRNPLEDHRAGNTSSEIKEIALRLDKVHRQPEIIQMLRNHGVIEFPHDRRHSFGTALAAAAHRRHTDIVRTLLRTNLNVDDAQWYRYAGPGERRGHLEIVRVLLEAGAQVNNKTASHGYAHHGALAKGHEDVSLTFLEFGADIRAIGGKYETALHAVAVAVRGILGVIEMCLESGN